MNVANVAPAPAELCIFLAFLLVWVPAALVMIIGALKMKRLESWGWAMAAAVVASLPITPLFPLSLALGIWAIFVLNRPDVKRVFGRVPHSGWPAGVPEERDEIRHTPRRPPGSSVEGRPAVHTASEVQAISPLQSERPSDVSAAVPRFSRKAIVGAVWATFFFLALVLALVSFTAVAGHTVVSASQSAERESPTMGVGLVMVLLGLALLIPGITAPFGTTILGVLAISDIRHSRGRLVGLPLALADALLFPLLVLNAAIYGAYYQVGSILSREAVLQGWPSAAHTALFLAVLLAFAVTVIAVNLWIIRRTYLSALPDTAASAHPRPFTPQDETSGSAIADEVHARPSMTSIFSRAWNRLWEH